MSTAQENRRGTYVLVGLFLFIVQPVCFIAVRCIMGPHPFDGLTLLSILVMLAGAWIVRVHTAQDGR